SSSDTLSPPAISTLSLHDALPISARLSSDCAGVETDRVDWRKLVALGGDGCHRVSIAPAARCAGGDYAAFQQVHTAAERSVARTDRKSTRLNSSHLVISYAVFCLK